MPKIVRFHEVGGPEVLQLEELPAPQPKKGEVRIKVEAIGLNRAEMMFRSGQYLYQPKFPSTLGYEASGTVEEIGPGVTGFKPGDRVSSVPSFSLEDYYTYGEVALLPASALANYPENLSPVEGASIWMQYLTAYGLIEFGKMHQGHHVLITAAASSVGLAAIQLTNSVGAIPIATSRNEGKTQSLLGAGAKFVVNTKRRGWAEKVREITAGAGVDLAFDPVAGPELEQVAETMRPEGMIFVYGALASEPTPFPLFSAIGKNLILRGYTLFSVVQDPERGEHAKRWVYDQIADGKLKPIIARTFSLDRIVDAHRYMESNDQIGKIVVTP
ncbi:MAG: zinc-dependent alcohol dehydrogenase family protein [Verrucomicrobia bacterium]|nr:zinc-dependent alcohol dehydrogenase family protein [Verrucomicrobiota bacterium]